MKLLLWTLLLFTNLSFAQSNEKFFMGFLNESELKSENMLIDFSHLDFTNVWSQSPNEIIFGIIGLEHQRIQIKLLTIKKNRNTPNEYIVTGKSRVKETICEFKGTITLTKIWEVKELHFGVDDEYSDKGIKTQGVLVANYNFIENPEQNHSGIFKGQLYTKWYLNSNNEVVYDDIESISDSYANNAFIGTWKSNSSGKEKLCNWADWRVPNANHDFDIGAGEFSVSEKYWNKGWLDIALNNQIPNEAIVREKSDKELKDWWE
jgi:hypothetical protein